MLRTRKFAVVMVVIAVIGICVYVVYDRVSAPRAVDVTVMPTKADDADRDALAEEVRAYTKIIRSRRDLTNDEFKRLMEVARSKDFESPAGLALAAAVAHVNTQSGPQQESRKSELTNLSLEWLRTKEPIQPQADIRRKVSAIGNLRDLGHQQSKELVRPYLKHPDPLLVRAAETYFAKIEPKKQ